MDQKKCLNKVLYVTVSFSLAKVLMEDSFQYLLKNVYYSFFYPSNTLEKKKFNSKNI